MAAKALPSPELLRQLLRYEPESGKLFWLPRPRTMFPDHRSWSTWNSRFANKEAFTSFSDGYFIGSVDYVKMKAHRVIWAIHTGEWPNGDIDHINRVRSDNRISNLRCVTRSENLHNCSLRRDNTSGKAGVRWCKTYKFWEARINHNGKFYFLGYHDSFAAAAAARDAFIAPPH